MSDDCLDAPSDSLPLFNVNVSPQRTLFIPILLVFVLNYEVLAHTIPESFSPNFECWFPKKTISAEVINWNPLRVLLKLLIQLVDAKFQLEPTSKCLGGKHL
jgi:hypothetical protein